MKNKLCFFILVAFLSSCATINNNASESDKFSTTTWGALTGAAVGAGLGLLIGSASGNAGEGLILGSLGGAATGGIVGSKFEEKERVILNQQEALNQRRNKISSKEKEILSVKKEAETDFNRSRARKRVAPRVKTKQDESFEIFSENKSSALSRSKLSRNLRPDTPKVREIRKAVVPNTKEAEPFKLKEDLLNKEQEVLVKTEEPTKIISEAREEVVQGKIEEKQIGSLDSKTKIASGLPPAKTEVKQDAQSVDNLELEDAKANQAEIEKTQVAKKAAPSRSSGCAAAEAEASRARTSSTDADKLFYYRRAIRLCPNEPKYNVEMGKIFSAVGRTEEAKSQFEQALKIDPNNASAKYEMKMLKLDNAY